MKGLLKKEFYVFSARGRAVLLVSILFLICSLQNPASFYFAVFPVIILSNGALTTLAYDERCAWQTYAGVLPISVRTRVYAKYLFSLVLICGYTAVYAVIRNAWLFLSGSTAVGYGTMTPLYVMLVGLIVPCVLYPLMFRFGVERGRIFYYIVIFAAAIGTTVFSNFTLTEAREAEQVVQGGTYVFAAAALAVGAVLFFLSARLSALLYERRLHAALPV
ncbi:MAG: ABC-2 transporter permease [Eubacteriales bacterium]